MPTANRKSKRKQSAKNPRAKREDRLPAAQPPQSLADEPASNCAPPAPPAPPSLSLAAGQPQAAASRKPGARRRKPVRIGEALRQRGFDEHTIAASYVDVAQRLKGKSDKNGGVEKLLVDVLKEVSRHLEPARPPDRAGDRLGAPGAPIHIHLIHSVARPARSPRDEFRAPMLDAAPAADPAPESEAHLTDDPLDVS
jgi:hypothetical protein